MDINKILEGSLDEIADNIFNETKNTTDKAKAIQKQRIGENVQYVIDALKKIEADLRGDLRDEYRDVANKLSERIISIKNGQDGRNGADGRAGKDGRAGRDGIAGAKGADGLPGRDGLDGVDGVSVTDASIDFDGSLIISLSNGRVINVGEVVSQDLADKIQVISTMSTNGAVGIQDEGTSISTGVKNINFVGASVTSTASGDNVTVNIGAAGTGVFDAGTALLPSITTTGDLNTGVYFPAADTVGITTGGAQRGAFSSTGLAVTGAVSASGTITANSVTGLIVSNGYQELYRTTNDATSLAHLLFYRGSGAGTFAGIYTIGNAANGVASLGLTISGTTIAAISSTGIAVTGTLSTTGVSTFAAGTVALPSITTSGDTNTGVYFPAADTVGITAGGVENLRIGGEGILVTRNVNGAAYSKVLNTTSGSGAYAAFNASNGTYVLESGVFSATYTTAGVFVANSAFIQSTNNLAIVAAGTIFINPNGAASTVATITSAGLAVTGTLSTTGVATFAAGTVALPSITTSGDTNTGVYFPAADTIAFTEGGAEAMRIDSSGNVLVGKTSATANGGDVQVSKGITFPATQVAASDVNTLDDYEEGTWTPSIGGTATYNVQEGRYTKIGRVVTVSGRLHILLKLTGSGTAVSGLPFTSAATFRYGIAIGKFSAIGNSAFTVYGESPESSTTFELFCTTAAGTSNYVAGVFADNTNIVFSFTYSV